MSVDKITNLRSKIDILHEVTCSSPEAFSNSASRDQLFNGVHPCDGCEYKAEECRPSYTIGVSDSGYAEIVLGADGLATPQQLSACVTRISKCAIDIGNVISSVPE